MWKSSILKKDGKTIVGWRLCAILNDKIICRWILMNYQLWCLGILHQCPIYAQHIFSLFWSSEKEEMKQGVMKSMKRCGRSTTRLHLDKFFMESTRWTFCFGSIIRVKEKLCVAPKLSPYFEFLSWFCNFLVYLMTIVFELHLCSRLAMQCTYRYLNDLVVPSELRLVRSSHNLLYDCGVHLVIS